MKINKGYQVRLKTTVEIEKQFQQFAGCCRKVWNMILELSLRRLNEKCGIIWYDEADFWVKLWKKSEEYGFLKTAPAQILQQKLLDLDLAFKQGFDKNQPEKHLPTWRKLGQHDSFRYPQHCKIENRRIFLPKIGWVGFFKSQSIIGILKSVTIKRIGCHWYASILVEQERQEKPHLATSAIGIDLGVNTFAALSNGCHIAAIDAFNVHEKKLSRLQRRLAKKKKFSANWNKLKTKIKVLHRKIANIRHDFLQKESTKLSHNHAMIVVEDLKIKNMSKSAKGTVDDPGCHVKAKSGLNKSILDQGWGMFKTMLAYKLKWLGGLFLAVNPRYTSQCCSRCGYIAKENRVSQSLFHCQRCHYEDNADTNAAKNILAAGHAVLACGEAALAVSVKQEPLGIGNLVPAYI